VKVPPDISSIAKVPFPTMKLRIYNVELKGILALAPKSAMVFSTSAKDYKNSYFNQICKKTIWERQTFLSQSGITGTTSPFGVATATLISM